MCDPASVQFDLFLDSAEVVAENELREALRAGNASEAQQKLTELRTRDPDHPALEPASTMIEALKAAPPRDSNTALECGDWRKYKSLRIIKKLFPHFRHQGRAQDSLDDHGVHAYIVG